MPAKRKSKAMKGKGLKEIVEFVKNNKLVSKGLGYIPHPLGQVASVIADQLGYGKKRKAPKRRTMKGTGIFSDLGSGIGGAFSGLGSGIGSVAHGLFGSGKMKMKMNMKSAPVMLIRR
jgi:hypothetical protein